MMEKACKIRSNNILSHFKLIGFGAALGLFMLVYYRLFEYDPSNFESLLLSIIGVTILFLLFTFILFLQYYINDRFVVLAYESGLFTYHNKKQKLSFVLKDISSLTKVTTISRANNSIEFVPWSRFGYFVFRLNNGRRIVITSLVISEPDILVDIENQKVKKTFYPLIL